MTTLQGIHKNIDSLVDDGQTSGQQPGGRWLKKIGSRYLPLRAR